MTEPVRPIVWMRALRDTSGVGGSRLSVLWALGLRMRKDGTGWATQEQLAADTVTSVATVRRALDWAQDASYLERTRRGHRLGDGRALGSQYLLTLPVSTAHGDGLKRGDATSPGATSTAQTDVSTAQTDVSTAHHTPTQGSESLGSENPCVPPFGGSPNGDHPRTVEDLHDETFDGPFQLGKLVAVLCHEGARFIPEQFRDLVLEKFDFDDERHAWAGFHRYYCKPRCLCVCKGDESSALDSLSPAEDEYEDVGF